MPRHVVIRSGVTATFETWTALTASNTMLLNAHGMQDAAFYEPITVGTAPIPPRNYAFTVPWDRALFNPFFKNKDENLYKYMTRFQKNVAQFSSRAPRLAIYPFLFDTSWRPTFEWFVLRDLCDSVHFADLDGADYIMFDEFLRAPHWKSNGTIGQHYSSFLLLTCRSNLTRGIGMGGAKPAHPNGLYKVNGTAPHIHIA